MRRFIAQVEGLPGKRSAHARACSHALRAASFTVEERTIVDLALSDMAALTDVNRVYDELFAEGRRRAGTIHKSAAVPLSATIGRPA